MLFHTWPFAVFLFVVLPVYFALKKTRLWLPWLMAASYFFYGWWNPYYLLLVVYSTILDYFLVALMDHCRERKHEEREHDRDEARQGEAKSARSVGAPGESEKFQEKPHRTFPELF